MIKIQVDLPVALPDAFGSNTRGHEGIKIQIIPPNMTGADRYVRLEGRLDDVVAYLLDYWDHNDIPDVLENTVLLFDGEDD